MIIFLLLSHYAAGHSIIGWGAQKLPNEPLVDIVKIAAGGGFHSLAIKADGRIIGWGYNDYGQATPPEGNDFIVIAAGGSNSFALRFVCDFDLIGDLNDDCKVDLADFAAISENWLVNCATNPTHPSCVPR